VTLGAHTHTHPLLTTSNPEQVTEELVRPLALFQRELGLVPHHFCYPQARWNPALEEIVGAHYQSAVIGGGAWAGPAHFNPLRIPRVPIRRSDGWRYFRAKVAGQMANEEALYARLRQLTKTATYTLRNPSNKVQ
jgi:peptidoglycan/xylan/chitin deacetylase (PgdA/CDA1 family)